MTGALAAASFAALPAFIPSPPANGLHVGPLDVHAYGLMYVVGIALAMGITIRRWRVVGGDSGLVTDMALWAVPAGIIGARIYFDLTTPFDMPRHWWGPFAVWDGGLGVWGGILAGALVATWRVRRAGADWRLMADAAAPALPVAQAAGRIGNYFNQELNAGQAACRGRWRSPRRTGWPATRGTPRSSPPFCTSCSWTWPWPPRWSGSATTATSGRLACSPCT